MESEEYFLGTDYEWLAVDGDGCVGYFVTAGTGAVPRSFRESHEDYDIVNEELGVLWPVELPDGSGSTLASTTDELKTVTERGVFYFECRDEKGSYRRVATPRGAVKLSQLPPRLAELAGRTVLGSVCFARSESVDATCIRNA